MSDLLVLCTTKCSTSDSAILVCRILIGIECKCPGRSVRAIPLKKLMVGVYKIDGKVNNYRQGDQKVPMTNSRIIQGYFNDLSMIFSRMSKFDINAMIQWSGITMLYGT